MSILERLKSFFGRPPKREEIDTGEAEAGESLKAARPLETPQKKAGNPRWKGLPGKRFGPKELPLNISSVFVRRPVATTLLTIALALSGAVAFRLLPVAPLPQMDFPIVMVRASMPGAGPETMAATVATPLERALGHIAGVTEMTSKSSLGSSMVILQFELSRNINGAARDVQAAINAARSTLPSMPQNPVYRKINPAGAPILIISLTSKTLSPPQLYDIAQSVLAQKVAQVQGVGEVNIGGSALPSIRVEVNPDALSRNNLSMQDVSSCLKKANVFLPRGTLQNDRHHWLVGINDQLDDPEDYGELILAFKHGSPVRLKDVAKVFKGPQDVNSTAISDGKQGTLLMVFKAAGANVIETVDKVKSLVPSMRRWCGKDVELAVTMDKSLTVRSSLHEVEKSLLLSMALVVLVVFLFLKNARATAIPAVAAPVSLIGTFGVMYLAGYSLDNLSLMALTIATGFVVDDAIVVLENIARRLEKGQTPLRAALSGSREVGFTIISMSLSLVAVFIPILCMPSIIGSLFREFAVVLSVAVLISMAVSLTTTPMMCAAMLRQKTEQEERGGRQGGAGAFFAKLAHIWSRALEATQEGYTRSLRVVVEHKKTTLFVFFLVLVLNGYLYVSIPKGFFPQQDTGMIMGGIRMDQSLSFKAAKEKLLTLQERIRSDPAVEHVSSFLRGGKGDCGMFITLKPLKERGIDAKGVINRLRPKLMRVPGIQIFLQPAQDLHMGGRSSRSQYQYTLQSDDIATLRQWGRKLKDELAKSSIILDVDSDLEERGLQTFVEANRDLLKSRSLSMKDVDNALGLSLGQSQIGNIYKDKNQYKVVVEFADEWRQSNDALDSVRLRSGDGLVPLSSLSEVRPSFGSVTVAHQGQFAAVTISFNLAGGKTLEDAKAIIDEAAVRIGMPPTVIGSFQGNAKMFADAIKMELLLVVAAILVLYIVLGVLYESLVHPLTILSTLPPAGGGALIALMAFGMEFSVIALIGVLLLCGLVKKNAILMIDFALTAERQGLLDSKSAILEACRLRFRPIMMTTFAALFGAVPLALGQGDGAELRQPLGVAIVGGLIVSQILTLYTTPVIFLWLDSLHQKLRKKLA